MSASAATTSEPVIELEQIHKVYEAEKVSVHALRGIDLRIERGEFVSLMGAALKVGNSRLVLTEESMLPVVDLRAYVQHVADEASGGFSFAAERNVQGCLLPCDFYTDETSCTMDAFNLAVGRVRSRSIVVV